MEFVRAVKCMSCGKLHASNSDDFFCFYGNVTIGVSGGIIGSCDIDHPHIFCRNTKCIDVLLLQCFDCKPITTVNRSGALSGSTNKFMEGAL
jgi:hypothetical protein